ncbi:MAG: hypothetical protein JSS61_05290 [Verrucomicrobia bacterium]|nr:hypothetical protein [Verrucomicrobiota bacterium]
MVNFVSASSPVGSVSASLMLGITILRNQPGFSNKLAAQGGYAVIALASLVETVFAATATVFGLLIHGASPKPYQYAKQWVASSAFTLGWSVVDFFLNPFVQRLVADETSAREVLRSCNLMMIPSGAIV